MLLSLLFLSFPLLAADDFDRAVDAEYRKKSSACITAPQSGAPAGDEAEARGVCETDLRAKIRADLGRAQLAGLTEKYCAPGCNEAEKTNLGVSIKILVRSVCESRMPKPLHRFIRETPRPLQCGNAPGKNAGEIGDGALKVGIECAKSLSAGEEAQVQTLTEKAWALPGKILAAPGQVLEGISRTAIRLAKDGAMDPLMKTHNEVMTSAGDLLTTTRKTLDNVNNYGWGIYECMEPKQALLFACYVGGMIGVTAAESAALSKGSATVMNSPAAATLLENAAALFEKNAGSELLRARAAALANETSSRKSLLRFGGDDPVEKIAELRAGGKTFEANELEQFLAREMSGGKLRDLGPAGDGITGARFVRTENGVEGVWKPYARTEYADGGAEIGAQLVDRKMGRNLVPVTTEAFLNGQRGTIQLRAKNLKKSSAHKSWTPPSFDLFDYLIGHRGRNPSGTLETKSGREYSSDHGRAFRYESFRNPEEEIFVKALSDAKSRTEGQYNLMRKARALYHHSPTPENASRLRVEENLFNVRVVAELKELRPVIGKKAAYEKLKETKPEGWSKLLEDRVAPDKIVKFQEHRKEVIRRVEEIREMFGDAIFEP